MADRLPSENGGHGARAMRGTAAHARLCTLRHCARHKHQNTPPCEADHTAAAVGSLYLRLFGIGSVSSRGFNEPSTFVVSSVLPSGG
jgi:hypothetical protein